MAFKVSNTTIIDNDRKIINTANVGINTDNVTKSEIVGAGNSFRGLYVANGAIIFDNTIGPNFYIGTSYNGVIAGPVEVLGTLTVDGNLAIV